MKTYTVHINPAQKDSLENAEFVPEGFSFLMFIPIVNVVVAAYRRCWWLLAAMIGIELFTYVVAESEFFHTQIAGPFKLMMALRLSLLFFFGLWVNDFWRAKLAKRGYEMVGIVSATSRWSGLEEAQAKFYERYVSEQEEKKPAG